MTKEEDGTFEIEDPTVFDALGLLIYPFISGIGVTIIFGLQTVFSLGGTTIVEVNLVKGHLFPTIVKIRPVGFHLRPISLYTLPVDF